MTYQERQAQARKRLADHAAGKRVYFEQATRDHDAAREARSQRVEDNGITWRG